MSSGSIDAVPQDVPDGNSLPDFVLLSEVDPEPVRWLWFGRIPANKLTIIEGDPGLGKSTMALDIAARTTAGMTFPNSVDSAGVPRAVVILSAEDGLADTIRPRLEASGGHSDRAVVLNEPELEQRLLFPEGTTALEATVRQHQAAMVIIDPMAAYMSPSININKDTDVRLVLTQLARLAERNNTAVIMIRHLNKNEAVSSQYRGGGSIGITGAARSVLLVAQDPSDSDVRVVLPTKSNVSALAPGLTFKIHSDSEIEAPRIQWGEPCGYSAEELMVRKLPSPTTKLADAEDFLTNALAGGPRSQLAVQDQAREKGISASTLRRAKKRLGVQSEKLGGRYSGEQHWTWALPTLKSTNLSE